MSDTSADHRLESARLTHEELRTLLGPEKFGEYERFLNQWGSGYVLGTRE